MKIQEFSKEYYLYIEKYIIPNEPKETIIEYYSGNIGYDFDYILEHMEYNTITDYKLITN